MEVNNGVEHLNPYNLINMLTVQSHLFKAVEQVN